MKPSPGVLLALRGRLCNMVINRMHKSSDGDIVLPQRGLSIVGTSSWVVDDPDELTVPEDHVARMYTEGAKLIPAVRHSERRVAWSAARPLVASGGAADTGRELSRTFKTFDHKETDGVEGFVTLTGGKATTLRGMAELCSDVICRKLGHRRALPYTGDRAASPHRLLRRRGGGMRGRTMAVTDQPQTHMTDTTTCRMRVYRYKRGDGDQHYDEFDVPVDEHTTVLDALRWIQLHRDRSLSVRYSCMHASCGTCGVRVDGDEELACVCALADDGDEVTVEPLANPAGSHRSRDRHAGRSMAAGPSTDDHPHSRSSRRRSFAGGSRARMFGSRMHRSGLCGLRLSRRLHRATTTSD